MARQHTTVLALDTNMGVPEGRNKGVSATHSAIVAFLDDDAELAKFDSATLDRCFADERVGAVAFRIVDETGQSARRHVPRLGRRGATQAGPVAVFLGGACAIRRDVYTSVGGYWADLFYGHEELDLSWRLADQGFVVRYEPSLVVAHPSTTIERHPQGWRLSARNRVWVARRNLPLPVLVVHVLAWLVLGLIRAPGHKQKTAYLAGWIDGWRPWPDPNVTRQPIRWRTIVALSRRGRPPLI